MDRGRFAPSPTGDLHLGSARTALFAWLAARAAGARFVLRIEDLDRPRVVPGAAERILEDLALLGLDWDEGPDRGGPRAPYTQSERTALYEAAIERLDEQGAIVRCYCSRAEIARAAQGSVSAPHGPSDDGPRYPGTCRALTRDQIASHQRAGRRPSLRLRVDAGEPGAERALVSFVDGVQGSLRSDVASEVGDFVLRRADGVHAYQLAVVVDDAAMEITDVVRGDDLLSSTARQILLYRALGAPLPRFAHLPLVLGPDGQRLSKRHGSIAVRALIARGGGPRRVLTLLARSLLAELPADEQELSPEALLPAFSLARVSRSPTLIDPARLAGAARHDLDPV